MKLPGGRALGGRQFQFVDSRRVPWITTKLSRRRIALKHFRWLTTLGMFSFALKSAFEVRIGYLALQRDAFYIDSHGFHESSHMYRPVCEKPWKFCVCTSELTSYLYWGRGKHRHFQISVNISVSAWTPDGGYPAKLSRSRYIKPKPVTTWSSDELKWTN